jgi:flagellar protein FlgJ
MRTAASQQLATNGASLDALRGAAQRDPKGAIKDAAKQFEALFMQELMKSMRATTMASGMLENGGTELGTSMLDQQYATQLSGQKGGLSEAIARQLERQMGISSSSSDSSAGAGLSNASSLAAALAARRQAAQAAQPAEAVQAAAPAGAAQSTSAAGGTAQSFVERHGAAAAAASAATGIPAQFMLAQAAHETGWGRREIRGSDGSNSYNLFGIKAGAGWTGPTVTTTTTEVINGQPQKVQAKFRAYSSYEESFKDYGRLMTSSPRYAAVVQAGSDAQGFARGLQRAGYATDPDYAQKLGRIIQTTQRLQRAADTVQTAQRLTT